MKTDNKKYTGLWMDKYVTLNTNLTPSEKLLLADVIILYNSTKDVCFKTNEAFSVLLSASTSAVKRSITSLQKKGYLQKARQVYDSSGKTRKRYLIPNISFAKKEYKKLQNLELKNGTKKKSNTRPRAHFCTTSSSLASHIDNKEITAKGSVAPKGENKPFLVLSTMNKEKEIEVKTILKKETIINKESNNTNMKLEGKELEEYMISLKGELRGTGWGADRRVQKELTPKQSKERILEEANYNVMMNQYNYEDDPFG